MAVQSRLLYAFRGWLAFLAFMDLGTAGRSYIERRSFLEDHSHAIPGIRWGYADISLWEAGMGTAVLGTINWITITFAMGHPKWFAATDDFTVSRMLGMYSLLKALALIHCTLYIHYPPVVSLGYCALAMTIFLYCSEALYFHSCTLNFYVIFPCILNALTLGGLVYLPGAINLWAQPQPIGSSHVISSDAGDENTVLFRQLVKTRRPRNKQ